MATLGTNFFSSRRHTRVASTDDSDSRKQRLHILPGMKESEDSFNSTKSTDDSYHGNYSNYAH